MAVRRRPSTGRWMLALGVFSITLLGWGGWQGLRALIGSDLFTIRYLEVEGCRILPREKVLDLLAPCMEESLLKVDADSVVAQVAALSRVAEVNLKRRLPGTLLCRIREVVPRALLYDGEFREVDGQGRKLDSYSTTPPDLPIIRSGGAVSTDSLLALSLRALALLESEAFDLSEEVSELDVDDRGLFYLRGDGRTRVVLGWKDYETRIRNYRDVLHYLERSFPPELDLRFQDQVIARKSSSGATS